MMDYISDDILQIVEDWYPKVNDEDQEDEQEEARDLSIWHNEAPIS